MKQRLREAFKGPVVFYPLLFAVFPILFLYGYNIGETSASQIWLPLGVSVAATLVLWAVLSLILRSMAKAALATAIFLALFFSYGRLYDGLSYLGASVPKHAHLLPTVLFIWGYCVYFVSRARRDFRVSTRLLNVTAVVLIAINLFNIGSYSLRLARIEAGAPPQTPEQAPAATDQAELGTLPDIYFIILDEYSHTDTLKEWYDYDNSEFIKSLEDKGFFVAQGSRTVTPHSPLVIAQILNMQYLDDEPWSESTFRKLAYSIVADFLRAAGYAYIYFGNWGDIGAWGSYMKDSADLYFNYFEAAATPWVSEFQRTLWNTTMLGPFYMRLVGTQYETAWRRQTVYTLEHLKAVPELEGPKFVFAHIMCPHPPYVFGPQGEYVARTDWANHRDKQLYRGQSIFISTEIEEVIAEIQKQSRTPPIIILQSDHGIRPWHMHTVNGGDEWRKILNAMYLPGMDTDMLYDNMSPVNTFRLIFNRYFGADYPLLEDD